MGPCVEVQTGSLIRSRGREKLWFLLFLLLIELGQVDAQNNPEYPHRGRSLQYVSDQLNSEPTKDKGLTCTFTLSSKTGLRCFNSSGPLAEKATVLFDFHSNHVNLWNRGDPHTPLPPCSSISSFPNSSCLVCLDHQDHQDQSVYVVCCNLANNVEVKMEAGDNNVKISEFECPKPPSDDTWKWWQIFILILLIIIAVLVVYGLWKKCCKTSKCLTRVKEEKAVERVGEEEEEEAAHLRRPEMECDAEAAV
ncbi:uncharacterized protein [Thunnus thynnus]|uniref:uncharacterized protein isoform X1 n=1 Tax=Thunnus thynnus TaxID=8237 RepID=UPI003526DE95